MKDQIELLEEINEGDEMATTTAEREVRRCWVLTYPNGDRVDLDGKVHFASEESAARDAARYVTDELGSPVPEQLDEDCVTISCSSCETVFDEDGDGIEHHESVESALSDAKQRGWTVADDGRAKCEPCSHDCDCHGCKPDCEGEGQ